jgi:hypothetical protein
MSHSLSSLLLLYAQQFEDQHAPQNMTIALREAAKEIERLTLLSQLTRAHPQSADGEMRHRAAADIARLTEENRLLRIENATLHGWIRQQDEYIKRLTAAARKGKT